MLQGETSTNRKLNIKKPRYEWTSDGKSIERKLVISSYNAIAKMPSKANQENYKISALRESQS